MKLLENKNAIIFGAKGGIGEQVARQYQAHGATTYLSDLKVDGIKENTDLGELRKLDATDEEQIKQYFNWFADENVSVDIVINCVGSAPDTHKHGQPAINTTFEDFMNPLRTSLASQFVTAKGAYGLMKEQGNGVIIFITSTLSKVGCPWCPGLTAAHAGTEGLMRSLANEWGPEGIRVLGVRSGAMVDTDTIEYTHKAMGANIGLDFEGMGEFVKGQTSLKRSTVSKELADVVAFAGSDMAGYMAGTTLNHSGGHVMD